MAGLLTNKIAVVTGGTRGIGRAIAERLFQEGASVALCGRTREGVERAVQEITGSAGDSGGTVIGEVADVSQRGAVSKFFQSVDARFGGLDYLINNAGVGVFSSVRDLTPEAWHRVIDLNVNGVYYCSHEALQRFANRGGGYIINISSLAGKNPFAGGAAYNASKFAVNGFSEAMMLDHRYDNVRVSYLMPGSVETGFSGPGAAGGASRSSWKIAPEDIAETVMFLLRMPARTLLSRIEMRPSKPKK